MNHDGTPLRGTRSGRFEPLRELIVCPIPAALVERVYEIVTR